MTSLNSIMTRVILGQKLAEKVNVAHTKIALVDRCGQESTDTNMLMIDDFQRYENGIAQFKADGKEGNYPLMHYGRNGLVETIVFAKECEYVREITDDFESVINCHVYCHTDSGYTPKMVESYTEDLLLFDMSKAYYSYQDSVVMRYVKDKTDGSPRKVEFNRILQLKPVFGDKHNLYYFFDQSTETWIRLDGFISKKSEYLDIAITKKNFKNGVLTEIQLDALIASKRFKKEEYVLFNASASSLRQDSALFTKCTGIDDLRGFIEAVLDRTSSGLYSYIRKDNSDGIMIKDAIKALARVPMNITDAIVVPGVVDAFCIFNGKYETIDPEDGKPVQFADGLKVIRKRLSETVYEYRFGNKMPKSLSKKIDGYTQQDRIGCQNKGLSMPFDDDAMNEHLNTIRSGLLSGGKTGRILLFKTHEMAEQSKNLVDDCDMIFSGHAYDDIEPDKDGYIVTDENKIKLLFDRVLIVSDMNANKYLRPLIDNQDVNLMSFPPAFTHDGKINLSNQFCTSILRFKEIISDNVEKHYEHAGGKEVLKQLFEEELDALLASVRQKAENLSFADLENFESYAESCIRKINPEASLSDPNSRNSTMVDLVSTVRGMINNLNIKVKGFNAVGIVDVGLLVYGIRLLNPGQMYSGNVQGTNDTECGVMRSPKISVMECVVLTDIGRKTMRKQIRDLIKKKELPRNAFRILWKILRNIKGRMVMLPSFCRTIVMLLGGSDFDGDTYAVICDGRIVEVIKGIHRCGIDYGSFKGSDEKVIIDPLLTSFGYASVNRLIRAYFETGNPKIGELAHMNLKIISLIESIQKGKLTDENLESDFLDRVWGDEDNPETLVFMPGKPEYTRFFNLNQRVILADAETIDTFVKYCNKHSVTKVSSLYELLGDLSIIMSSVTGRVIDAAKSGETVYIPFKESFKDFESGYWKGSVGMTDVDLKYVAETVDDSDKVVLSELITPGVHTITRGAEEVEIFVIDDMAHELKNECAKIAEEKLNKFLRELDKKLEELDKKELLTNIELVNIDKCHECIYNIAYINSGIMNNRKDIRNDVAPYITDTARLYTHGFTLEQRLGIALKLSQRPMKKNVEDESELNLGMTRFYTRFGAEIALLALEDRFKETGETNMLIKSKIYTTCDYFFEQDEKLHFEDGVAEINGGKALCDGVNGDYSVTIGDDGYAYIVADLKEYLEKSCEVKYKLAVNLIKNETYQSKLMNFVNDPSEKENFFVVSKVTKSGVFLYKISKTADEKGVRAYNKIGQIYVKNLNLDRNKDGELIDNQLHVLEDSTWNIDMVTSYINSSGTKYPVVCLSYDDNAPADIAKCVK